MKKICVALALILCLVICAFAFASCGPKKPASTEPATTPATTDGNSGVCQHVWGEFEVDTPATCTVPGVKSKYCTICDAQDPDSITEIPQLDHTPADEFTIDKEPTCTEGGFKSKHCTVCGNPVADTVLPIDPDPTKHNVEAWSATPTLLNPTVHRTGECTICHQPQEEDATLTLSATAFTASSSRHQNRKLLSEVQGEEHFYPDESNGNLGNDLLIEYSVLWNNTLLNLNGSTKPYLTSRIAASNGTGQTNLCYFSPTENVTGSDCKYAGSFETTGSMSPYSDGEVTSPPMSGDNYSSYPNLGGADQNNPEWGWHRVGIRVHQIVTNLSAVAEDTTGETAAVYDVIVTLYIDGVPVSKLSNFGGNDKTNFHSTNYLYSVKSDGVGGVTYEDNAGAGVYVFALLFDSNKPKADTTAYWVDTDVSISCGQTFVQSVEKVASPVASTFTLDDMDTPDDTTDDVTCPAAIWFKLAD